MCDLKRWIKKSSEPVSKNYNQHSIETHTISESPNKRNLAGLVAGIYYTNWSPYDPRNHFLPEINTDQVSHIYYAFFLVDAATGKIKSSDKWSDFEKPPDNYKCKLTGGIGTLFQLKMDEFRLKKQSFKAIMSVGGWSNREAFSIMVKDESKIETFINSCVETMFEYGFDGIDLDWEFPEDDGVEPMKYYQMVKELRIQLDSLECSIFGKSNRRFHLSVATPGYAEKLEILPIKKMDEYVDLWNMMTYDYYGEWSESTGIHCNLYGNKSDDQGLNGDAAIKYMIIKHKIQPEKLVLGMVLYGRSFTNVEVSNTNQEPVIHCSGQSFKGVGGVSKEVAGMWPYTRLPLPNSKEIYDPQYGAAFCYNSQTKTMVGYDNIDSVQTKSKYIQELNLAGTFWWESSGNTWKKESYSLVNEFYINAPSIRKNSTNIYMDEKCRQFYAANFKGQGFLSNFFGTT